MPTHNNPRPCSMRRGVVAAAVGVPLLLAACGDDDDASSEPSVVTITAADCKFEGLQKSAVGSTFSLANSSKAELHEAVAIRFPDDEERSIDELAKLPEAELVAIFAGEPAFVLLAMPGAAPADQIAAVGDGTVTEAGRYAIVCFIPTGVDPQVFLDAAATSEGPPDAEGGPPHFANGMYAEIKVG